MIATLRKLGAAALLERFIADIVTPAYDGSENTALVSSVSVLGDAKAAAVLSALVSARMPDCPDECTAFLLALSKDPAHCFPEVAESAVAGLDRIGIQDAKLEAFDWEAEQRRRALGPQFLENLLQALQRFKTATHCEAAAEKLAARPETFSPVTLVVTPPRR